MTTNKLRAAVVDDEELALRLMTTLLEKQADIEIVAQARSGHEAVKQISDTSPDVVFLDIEMPGLNGFEVVKALQADNMPMIVFTTAFDQYALQAFDVYAIDYILKPVDAEHVTRALTRVRERLAEQLPEGDSNKSGLLGAIQSLQNPSGHSPNSASAKLSDDETHKRIVIKDRDEIFILKQENIQWVDAAGDYICIHSDGKTYIKRSTMREIEAELTYPHFERVHRSTIVNTNCIEKVIPHAKGEFYLLLGDEVKIKVSRNYRNVVKAFLENPA